MTQRISRKRKNSLLLSDTVHFKSHESLRQAKWCIRTECIAGLPSSIKLAFIHLYTWMETGTVRVKCLAKNATQCSRPGHELRLLTPEYRELAMRANDVLRGSPAAPVSSKFIGSDSVVPLLF